MKLINRDKENTELLITTGFVLIVIGFINILNATNSTLILSGLVIIGIGAYRFFKNKKGKGVKKK